jgi:hypothetical protein
MFREYVPVPFVPSQRAGKDSRTFHRTVGPLDQTEHGWEATILGNMYLSPLSPLPDRVWKAILTG